MRPETYSIDEYDFIVSVPTTVQENDALAKKEGATLLAAIDHEVYHGTLGAARDKFASLVETKYGVNRIKARFEGEGENKKVVEKAEGFNKFLARVAAEKKLSGELPFADIAKAISVGGEHEVKYNPSATVRQPGKPPKLPNAYLALAKQLIEAKKVDAFGARYTKTLSKPLEYDKKLTGEELALALGWKIREMKLQEEKTAGLGAVV